MNARDPLTKTPGGISTLDLALLNTWQHGFPLVREPFAAVAQALDQPDAVVLDAYRRLLETGAISRIGGVFAPGAGGAALLAAMAVPPEQLHAVAEQVSAHPGVNHNYAREHAFNLWFVMTGRDAAAVEAAMRSLEQATGLPALRLRMLRAYRIDLGFDLRHATAVHPMRAPARTSGLPIAAADRALAEQVEAGLPPTARPFDVWAEALGCPADAVLATLQAWLDAGTLKRFGIVVRHHELGYSSNAMTVFNVPDALVDTCGETLAGQTGVTLAYRRERAPQWPYNLYCMVHGTSRAAVHEVLARVVPAAHLSAFDSAVLFSTCRFKQTGARRFRAHPSSQEATDALA